MSDMKMVKVRITAYECVQLSKVIEIPEKELLAFEAAGDRNERPLWFSKWADQFLDPLMDVVGGEEYEDVEVTRQK